MPRRTLLLLPVLTSLFAASCVSGASAPLTLPAASAERGGIGSDEIAAAVAQAPTVYDLILHRRHGLLFSRARQGSQSSASVFPVVDGPRVYVNGARLAGGVERLKQIRTESVLHIRYLSSIDATTRYGLGHQNGAILVTLR